jgi:hypothetical protein
MLLSFACTFFLQVFTQDRSRALKFDEFDSEPAEYYYRDESFDISKKIERFVNRLKNETGKSIYIIYYRARQTASREQHKLSNWANETKWEIRNKTRIPEESIFIIDGGYREKETLEYWIAPKNAAPPVPTLALPAGEGTICPEVSIDYDYGKYNGSGEIWFHAWVYPKSGTEYKWTISSGKIVEGQGSDYLKIERDDSNLKRITAFVEVSGLPQICQRTAYTTVDIAVQPFLVDHVARFNYSDLAARLDNFVILLQNDPSAKGYIIVYASRNGDLWQRKWALPSVMKVFAFRKFDMSRITIIKGGFREHNTVDSWIVPPGADPPVPTPSVDDKFITTPKKSRSRSKRRS